MKRWLIILLILLGLASVVQAPEPQPPCWHISSQNGVSWLTSPSGRPTFLKSVQTVRQVGNQSGWAIKEAAQLREWNFNAVGPWSDPAIWPYLPHTKDLNIFISCTHSIGDNLWEAEVVDVVRRQVQPLAGDTNLIGYYLDNELDWNKLAPYAEKYFAATHRAIRAFDSRHLILGVRFNRRPPASVLEASKGYVDAHSINWYSDTPVLPDWMTEIHDKTGLPVIISEFSYYADENSTGDRNLHGFGGHVKTQKQRAEQMDQLVRKAAAIPWVLGSDWFQLRDEEPEGRMPDGEDCNYGLVDIYGHPYAIMVDTAQSTALALDGIHHDSSH